MLPGERFKGWIDGLAEAWKDRLRGWMASWVMRSVNEIMEGLEPEAIELVRANLNKVVDHPATPQELKNVISTLLAGVKPLPLLVIIPLAVLLFIPTLTAIFQPLGNLLRYAQERLFRSFRLGPATITSIWNRDRLKHITLWDDLKDQGWTDEKIELAKELANIIPPLADMVRFADFGSFDPKIIELWREFYDAPGWIREPMALLGITGEWADKYWFSHWRQPGRYELGELHRRGLIDDELVKNAYLTQGYSSFWQEKLLELVKEPWTRVDVRRMWDMRTISEEDLRKAYQAVGYYDEWLDGMVLWTKVYVAFPDLIARWKNGWISLDDVRAELTGLGMPAARVEEMIETKIKAAQPERTAKERDLTKSEIVKGVKKEVISKHEGIELLMDMGYDEDEADYILAINLEVASGSPETFEEFKDLTQKYRRASGKEAKPMPEELKAAAAEVVKLTKDVEALQDAIKEEERGLIDQEVLPEPAAVKRDELRVSLHRAESALAAAQDIYDSLLAQWRHGG